VLQSDSSGDVYNHRTSETTAERAMDHSELCSLRHALPSLTQGLIPSNEKVTDFPKVNTVTVLLCECALPENIFRNMDSLECKAAHIYNNEQPDP